MIVVVCGGRKYNDRDFLFDYMDARHKENPITIGIHGQADGADRLFDDWCLDRGVQPARLPALWDFFRKRGCVTAAGPTRNRRMGQLRPEKGFAFPGGNGTADMIRVARALGIEMIEVAAPGQYGV